MSLGLNADAPAPIDTSYRLDMGRVLRNTFATTFSNLGPLWAAGLVIYSPSLLLVLLAALLPLSAEGTAAVMKIADLADRVLSLALVGAVCLAVTESSHGARATVGELIRFGFGRWGRVFVVSLFAGLLTLLGFVLCIVPGFFVMAAVWLAVPIGVLEDLDGGTSISRSRQMTEGNRTRALGINLALAVPLVLVAVVIFGGAYVAFALLQGSDAELPPRVEAVVQLALSLVLIPLECLYAAAPVVAYDELRTHREGVRPSRLAEVFE